jgi:hypothetical protein
MPDWVFLATVAGGVALLASQARRRAERTARRRARLGMTARPDLTRVPVELQRTVLWALCEGGSERGVVGGRLSLAAHDLDVTCFDLEDLRAKRFEWAWLDVAAPFRLHTPLTVVACTLARALPHLLIKRAGAADQIAPREHERGRSGSLGERAALAIADFRQAVDEPPPTLAREPVDVAIEGPWRAWAGPAAGDAERHLIAAIGRGLERDARDRELVIEALGPLVVVYAASGGPLGEDGLEDVVDLAAGVCERILEAAPVMGPRGVEG